MIKIKTNSKSNWESFDTTGEEQQHKSAVMRCVIANRLCVSVQFSSIYGFCSGFYCITPLKYAFRRFICIYAMLFFLCSMCVLCVYVQCFIDKITICSTYACMHVCISMLWWTLFVWISNIICMLLLVNAIEKHHTRCCCCWCSFFLTWRVRVYVCVCDWLKIFVRSPFVHSHNTLIQNTHTTFCCCCCLFKMLCRGDSSPLSTFHNN